MSQDHPLNNSKFGSFDRIDQLVCGSLQGPAYREALQWLDANPQRWRDCALAFLQEQAIEQELQAMARENLNSHRSLNSHPAKSRSEVVAGSRATSRHQLPSKQTDSEDSVILSRKTGVVSSNGRCQDLRSRHDSPNHPVTSHFLWKPAAKFVGVAALLLLSFGVGWLSSMPGKNSPLGSQGNLSQTDVNATEPHYDQHLARGGKSNNEPGGMRNVSTADPDSQYSWIISDAALRNNPDLVGNLSKRLLPIDQKIPPELLELERLGRIRIETSSSLMPIDQENGTVLVPVQQYQIVPVVFSY